MNDMNQASETTGARLARLRRAQNITQEELAERLGISRQAVSKWESDLAYPETDKLLALSRLYGCTVDYLLTGEEPAAHTPEGQAEVDPARDPNLWSRMNRAWGERPRYFEYKSRRCWGKLPLVHINVGFGRTASGVLAIGLKSQGIISIGLASLGVFSLGLCSVGLISVGILALGLLLAVGSIALGALAVGAIAVGLFTLGALSVGLFSVGALAAGHFIAVGDHAYGLIAVGQTIAEGRLWEAVGEFCLTPEQLASANEVIREHFPAWLRGIAAFILRSVRW